MLSVVADLCALGIGVRASGRLSPFRPFHRGVIHPYPKRGRSIRPPTVLRRVPGQAAIQHAAVLHALSLCIRMAPAIPKGEHPRAFICLLIGQGRRRCFDLRPLGFASAISYFYQIQPLYVPPIKIEIAFCCAATCSCNSIICVSTFSP